MFILLYDLNPVRVVRYYEAYALDRSGLLPPSQAVGGARARRALPAFHSLSSKLGNDSSAWIIKQKTGGSNDQEKGKGGGAMGDSASGPFSPDLLKNSGFSS